MRQPSIAPHEHWRLRLVSPTSTPEAFAPFYLWFLEIRSEVLPQKV